MTRQRPWRHLSPDAVIVTRPGPLGNPWRVVRNQGRWQVWWRDEHVTDCASKDAALDRCVEAFRMALAVRRTVLAAALDPDQAVHLLRLGDYPSDEEIRDRLAGRDVACTCPLSRRCHGDVLMAIAGRQL